MPATFGNAGRFAFRLFAIGLSLIIGEQAGAAPVDGEQRRPNIVLINADDK